MATAVFSSPPVKLSSSLAMTPASHLAWSSPVSPDQSPSTQMPGPGGLILPPDIVKVLRDVFDWYAAPLPPFTPGAATLSREREIALDSFIRCATDCRVLDGGLGEATPEILTLVFRKACLDKQNVGSSGGLTFEGFVVAFAWIAQKKYGTPQTSSSGSTPSLSAENLAIIVLPLTSAAQSLTRLVYFKVARYGLKKDKDPVGARLRDAGSQDVLGRHRHWLQKLFMHYRSSGGGSVAPTGNSSGIGFSILVHMCEDLGVCPRPLSRATLATLFRAAGAGIGSGADLQQLSLDEFAEFFGRCALTALPTQPDARVCIVLLIQQIEKSPAVSRVFGPDSRLLGVEDQVALYSAGISSEENSTDASREKPNDKSTPEQKQNPREVSEQQIPRLTTPQQQPIVPTLKLSALQPPHGTAPPLPPPDSQTNISDRFSLSSHARQFEGELNKFVTTPNPPPRNIPNQYESARDQSRVESLVAAAMAANETSETWSGGNVRSVSPPMNSVFGTSQKSNLYSGAGMFRPSSPSLLGTSAAAGSFSSGSGNFSSGPGNFSVGVSNLVAEPNIPSLLSRPNQQLLYSEPPLLHSDSDENLSKNYAFQERTAYGQNYNQFGHTQIQFGHTQPFPQTHFSAQPAPQNIIEIDGVGPIKLDEDISMTIRQLERIRDSELQQLAQAWALKDIEFVNERKAAADALEIKIEEDLRNIDAKQSALAQQFHPSHVVDNLRYKAQMMERKGNTQQSSVLFKEAQKLEMKESAQHMANTQAQYLSVKNRILLVAEQSRKRVHSTTVSKQQARVSEMERDFACVMTKWKGKLEYVRTHMLAFQRDVSYLSAPQPTNNSSPYRLKIKEPLPDLHALRNAPLMDPGDSNEAFPWEGDHTRTSPVNLTHKLAAGSSVPGSYTARFDANNHISKTLHSRDRDNMSFVSSRASSVSPGRRSRPSSAMSQPSQSRRAVSETRRRASSGLGQTQTQTSRQTRKTREALNCWSELYYAGGKRPKQSDQKSEASSTTNSATPAASRINEKPAWLPAAKRPSSASGNLPKRPSSASRFSSGGPTPTTPAPTSSSSVSHARSSVQTPGGVRTSTPKISIPQLAFSARKDPPASAANQSILSSMSKRSQTPRKVSFLSPEAAQRRTQAQIQGASYTPSYPSSTSSRSVTPAQAEIRARNDEFINNCVNIGDWIMNLTAGKVGTLGRA